MRSIADFLEMAKAEPGKAGRLPIVKISKTYYFVDKRLMQLRNVLNPNDIESIELAYSPKVKWL